MKIVQWRKLWGKWILHKYDVL